MSELTLGTLLRTQRERLGFTIPQVEYLTDISRQFLSALEEDRLQSPSSYIIKTLAFLYKISLAELSNVTAEKDPVKEAALAFVKWCFYNKYSLKDEVDISQDQMHLLLRHLGISAGHF